MLVEILNQNIQTLTDAEEKIQSDLAKVQAAKEGYIQAQESLAAVEQAAYFLGKIGQPQAIEQMREVLNQILDVAKNLTTPANEEEWEEVLEVEVKTVEIAAEKIIDEVETEKIMEHNDEAAQIRAKSLEWVETAEEGDVKIASRFFDRVDAGLNFQETKQLVTEMIGGLEIESLIIFYETYVEATEEEEEEEEELYEPGLEILRGNVSRTLTNKVNGRQVRKIAKNLGYQISGRKHTWCREQISRKIKFASDSIELEKIQKAIDEVIK